MPLYLSPRLSCTHITDVTVSADTLRDVATTQGARSGVLPVWLDADWSTVQLQPVGDVLVRAARRRQPSVRLDRAWNASEELVPLRQRHRKVNIADLHEQTS